MRIALERTLRTPACPALDRPGGLSYEDKKFDIAVIFTSVPATLAALKNAGTLAHRLHATITLMVAQVIPHPLPLTSPPVLLDWSERRFRTMAEESPIETRVHLYLCRDRLDVLKAALLPRSLVILGGRKRWWWPTRESRLARKLSQAGHEVIFTEVE